LRRSACVIALKDDVHPSCGWPALKRLLEPVDQFCAYAPGIGLVLLAEQDRASAHRWLEHAFGKAEKRPRAGIAAYPELIVTAEELVATALETAYGTGEGGVRAAEAPPAENPLRHVLLSPCMLRLYDLVARVAPTPLPVLIQGETGSGKELVARAVHEKSERSRAPFKVLNCAAIPASLIESVLFGHERGAFTGANRQAQGVFEQAQGGTVFLDEVGELSLQAQAALLRVLEQHRIVRVGGTREIAVDARVVAATHRDLAVMVSVGAFREDLMFRLDALTLHVPPLRARREEIVPMAEVFLARARSQWGVTARRLSTDVEEALIAYSWPGNVRQLKNVVERASVVCRSDIIDLEELPAQILSEDSLGDLTRPAAPEANQTEGFRPLPERVRAFEVSIISAALESAQGNHAQAARALGVPRRTLTSKVHAYGLAP